jgi:hypothetical protein
MRISSLLGQLAVERQASNYADEKLEDWLGHNNSVLVAVICLVLGTVLVGNEITWSVRLNHLAGIGPRAN